jgi:D-beta-D-heptose 7-phosphate kinase/D-beta-D-heptose 1-phosphate adenosyltransferase
VFIDTKKRNVPEGCYVKVNDIEYENLESKTNNLIITKGGEGAEYQGKLYPAEKVKVFDVVGAGDTFLAALTYGYLKYGSIEEAIPLANKAAAIAVSQGGRCQNVIVLILMVRFAAQLWVGITIKQNLGRIV